jgi:hypothetical protein
MMASVSQQKAVHGETLTPRREPVVQRKPLISLNLNRIA